ncbi:MAG: AAA family ATPase [Acutalibacteraceae bacterium]|nr:AAA family ATPase [Acutalibacteraceae bacterium]
MSEVKKSVLLCEIYAKAYKIQQKKYRTVTAEMIIAATIDKVIENKTDGLVTELTYARTILNKYFDNLNKAKFYMMEYIQYGKGNVVYDELYINSKLKNVEKLFCANGTKKMRIDDLLIAIFDEPTDTIKMAMEHCALKDEQTSSISDEDFKRAVKRASEIINQNAQEFEEHQQKKNTQGKPEVKVEDEDDMESPFDDDIENLFDDDFPFVDNIEDLIHNATDAIAKAVADTKKLRGNLLSDVFGQDNAVNTFAAGYFQSRMLEITGDTRKRPSATFLFAGPPGVGKTFLAESIAKYLELPFKRFDMSEYSDKEANLEFCGSDKVYKNGKPGNVTEFVEKNPRCVVLFDEIEKAHMCIIHLFLQMLDAGRLRDNFTDTEVSFSNVIIIMTTNAGKQLYEEMDDLSGVSRKVIINALQKDVNAETGNPLFPGAICSRFASGNVAMFNHISAHSLLNIAKNEIERNCEKIKKVTDINIKAEENVYSALLFAEGAVADARTIRSRSETFFNNELYELLRLIDSDKTVHNIKELKEIDIVLDFDRAEDEVKTLFKGETKSKMLVFSDKETVELYKNILDTIDVFGADDTKTAIGLLKDNKIDFALIDIKCGVKGDGKNILNVEDIDSDGRDFFIFMRDNKNDVPVYIIERQDEELSDEEEISFIRQGARDVLCLYKKPVRVVSALKEIALALYQQKCMQSLAKSNKVITFETLQTVSDDGETATIKLFDLKSMTAVKAEDTKNVLSAVSKPKVKFEQVIGAEDAKTELKYFVEYLKNPAKYMGTGLKAPRGVLLYGPPGTGKTMLAKAMASESGVTYIATEGNRFLKSHIGESPQYAHNLFKTARQYAPSVLFVDEIETIAKERTGAENDAVREEVLTAFLTEMDGFSSDPTKPVFVLAATNFDVQPGSKRSLDSALLRRFDRTIYVDLPDKEDRIKYLRLRREKNKALNISDDIIENIAIRSTGMSLALLDSVIELALRSAVRSGSATVDDKVFEDAFETFNSGEVKKWNSDELERVARHEAGHALLSWYNGNTPSYLTIVARGNHGGYMMPTVDEGKGLFTKNDLLGRVKVALGGRAAEMVYYGEENGLSTGAYGDLISATETATNIVCSYGMTEDYGLAVYNNAVMTDKAKEVVNKLLEEQLSETVRIISDNRDKIDALVNKLMEKNRLTGKEIEDVIGKKS